MSFLQNLFRTRLDGDKIAESDVPSERAQLELLLEFSEAHPPHDERTQQRWSQALPRPYAETLTLFARQGWLAPSGGRQQITPETHSFLATYRTRRESERAAAMAQVRDALSERDTSAALDVRRRYEAAQPLGTAAWTGPEPQLSYSALTRRILFLDHWLLDGLSEPVAAWLKLYAAEQHLWGTHWRIAPDEIPADVRDAAQRELLADEQAAAGMDVAEAAFWRAHALALHVDNQETWQRCKGGDHVRRIEIVGADDEHTCERCRAELGQQHLVVRVPELPHRDCTSLRGCRCRYEPVLESYEDL